ncbi:MAG TPA: flagellar hook capping FlgD N-terminal domain-containing protein [Opitutaceae bacterium]
MTVSATNPVATTTSAGFTPTTSSSKQLTQQDFLKLLSTQMQNQDPMQPMDDSQFMAQMAQFSTLQATTTMSTSMAALQAHSDLATASSLVGKKVTITNETAGVVTGTVTGVDASSGNAQVVIGGKSYSLSDITNVTPVPTATTTTPASSSSGSSTTTS